MRCQPILQAQSQSLVSQWQLTWIEKTLRALNSHKDRTNHKWWWRRDRQLIYYPHPNQVKRMDSHIQGPHTKTSTVTLVVKSGRASWPTISIYSIWMTVKTVNPRRRQMQSHLNPRKSLSSPSSRSVVKMIAETLLQLSWTVYNFCSRLSFLFYHSNYFKNSKK